MRDDERDDRIEIGEDAVLVDAEDAPPEIAKRAVTARIRARAVLVGGAVDLDGEADLGACEVYPFDESRS